MQIVGRQCERCAERIRRVDDASGCLRCDRAYHHACLGAARDRCPACRDDFAEQLQQVEARERATAAAGRSRGYVLGTVALVAFLVSAGVGVATHVGSTTVFVLGHVAIVSGVFLLALTVRFGSRRDVARLAREDGPVERRRLEHVRLALALGAWCGLALAAFGVAISVGELAPVYGAANAVSAVGYGICAVLLTFQGDVRGVIDEYDRSLEIE
jgi:hypothetical protein